jgi:hypothetical protein
MVRKGEPVELYKSGDQDKFYWRATGRGRDFRTTDRVHLEVGATDPTKPGVTKDDTNTYSMYMDSHNQKIGLKTSKVNGEKMAVAMDIDLKNGLIRLSDDSTEPGNRLLFDMTSNPIFHLNLSTGATFRMDGKDLLIKMPGKILLSGQDRIVLDSPLTVLNRSQAGVVIINAASVALNAAKDAVVTAGNVIGLNSASTKVSGFLIAATVRTTNAIKGALGSVYKAASVSQAADGSVSQANNSADTSTAGSPYKS